jgi:hypothetical protein
MCSCWLLLLLLLHLCQLLPQQGPDYCCHNQALSSMSVSHCQASAAAAGLHMLLPLAAGEVWHWHVRLSAGFLGCMGCRQLMPGTAQMAGALVLAPATLKTARPSHTSSLGCVSRGNRVMCKWQMLQ